MKLVLYFRCITNNRLPIPIPIPIPISNWYRYSQFNHVPSCNINYINRQSMPSMLHIAQANRSAHIRVIRPMAWSLHLNSTTMRAITWASNVGPASSRSRRTKITPRGRPSGQNVSQMASGQVHCPNVAATRKCSFSTAPTMSTKDERMISRPGWSWISQSKSHLM